MIVVCRMRGTGTIIFISRQYKTTRMSFKMSDNHDLLNDNDMCSFSGYEVDDVCSNNDIDACGDGMFVGVFTRCKLEQRT